MLLRRSGVVDVGNDSSSSTFLVSIFGDSFVVLLILRSVFVFVCLRFDLICLCCLSLCLLDVVGLYYNNKVWNYRKLLYYDLCQLY